MDSKNPEITVEVLPFLRVHKNGTVERLTSTETVPSGHDSETNVISKDIVIIPETGVTARLYYPNSTPETTKLPLVIYLHGGGFMVSAPADPLYHNNTLNRLVAEANVVAVSVDYRLVPEHPLPAAYEDSWAALQWVASHASEDGKGSEKLLRDRVDFKKVFLAGDSAGANNMVHHIALKLHDLINLKIMGLVMINPYFWGKEPIGMEVTDLERRKMVDLWWGFVCPSDKGIKGMMTL